MKKILYLILAIGISILSGCSAQLQISSTTDTLSSSDITNNQTDILDSNKIEDEIPSDIKAESIYETSYIKISSQEAKDMMDTEKEYILLDVRTEEEFKEKRIDKAILIPDYEITERAESEISDKSVIILVYCRSGRRSANASEELAKMGYTNVYDFGGIIDWKYETISD